MPSATETTRKRATVEAVQLVQAGVKADHAHHLLHAQLPQRRVSSTVGSPSIIRSR
jgi:hypothetical protein